MSQLCEICKLPAYLPFGPFPPNGCIDPGNAPCLRLALSAATARAEAAEAKVRDVETLAATRCIVTLGWSFDGKSRTVSLWGSNCPGTPFAGDTPVDALAAAAKWVRENSPPQKKPTDEGGRGGDDGGVVK